MASQAFDDEGGLVSDEKSSPEPAKTIEPHGPSKVQTWLQKTGLTMPVPLLILKASIPPTVAIAFYQSNVVAKEYGNQGYLVAITSILGFAIMPRARFIQTILLNLLSACIATSMACLSLWSAVQARYHTTPTGRPLNAYNSSASAVCAVWLFFQIFFINALRSKLPQLQFPVIVYAIFSNISLVYGVQFPTTAAALTFTKTLLKCFLTGFALATATHFIVFPINARKPVFGEMTGMLNGMRGVVKAQIAFMQSFEIENLAAAQSSSSNASSGSQRNKKHMQGKGFHHKQSKTQDHPVAASEKALKGATGGLVALAAKMSADVDFAKREIAIGKLTSQDFSIIMKKMRDVTLPLLGLGSLVNIARKVSHFGGWDRMFAADQSEWNKLSKEEREKSEKSLEEWQDLMRSLHQPFAQITSAMEQAIEHVLLILELKPRPKVSKRKKSGDQSDLEGHRDPSAPGESEFAKSFEDKIQQFYNSRSTTLHEWCEQHGIDLEPNSFEPKSDQVLSDLNSPLDTRRRGQLYVILYMEYLLYAASKALLQLVAWADSKVSDGTMKKSRFIFPGRKRLQKWIWQTFSQSDQVETEEQMSGSSDFSYQLSLGSAFSKHDPEHLPPTTTFEKATDWVRRIPKVFASPHCSHGLRAACATMSIGIVAYLHSTQTFFIKQRLVWAMIMVAFSMQRTSGQSAFQFGMRFFGTLIAMIASYIVWYIVNGHTAGVIVFLWVWLLSAFYVVLTKPRYVIVGVLSAITTILIVGYELQVKKNGVRLSETNGQPAYPTYTLAPYRLATVGCGLLVAYIWTIFPYPVTEHSELRRDVSNTLYLLANYYSVVHETFQVRTSNLEGDPKNAKSPGRILEKARHAAFLKVQLLLNQITEVSSYTKWQIFMGGRFPKETYDEIADKLERIMRCIALMGYASTSFSMTHEEDHDSQAEWLGDFKRMVSSVGTTSHQITARLSSLSYALSSGHPLPPYLPRFEPLHLIKTMDEMDKDILSVRHLAEPGYAAFAVVSIASRALIDELNEVTDLVKGLVGEMDFSLKCVPVADSPKQTKAESLASSREQDRQRHKSD